MSYEPQELFITTFPAMYMNVLSSTTKVKQLQRWSAKLRVELESWQRIKPMFSLISESGDIPSSVMGVMILTMELVSIIETKYIVNYLNDNFTHSSSFQITEV